MTELMKRYWNETGKDAITFSNMETHFTDDYVAWLELQNLLLKLQLTWRPVSEKPERDCQCFVSLDDGEMVIIGMWKCGYLHIEEKYRWLGIKGWLPLPPAPEGN